MKSKLLLFFLTIFGVAIGQTTEYSGIVKIKGDKDPLPGVMVIIKGTKIGTQTDIDGNFKIIVPDSLNVLSFSSFGIKPMEIKLGKDRFLEVFVKENCHIDWFDAQRIGFYANSGVLNNPVGGEFHFTFPAFFGQPTLKTGIGYQTNLRENRFLNAYLNLEHLFVDCGFSIDINSSVRKLELNDNLDSNRYSLETSINMNRIQILAGFSNVDYVEQSKNKIVRSNGPLLGLGTWIGPPFNTSVKAKTSIYSDLIEYQVEFKRDFKRLSSFIRYNKIGSFNEFNIGIGYQLTYYLKKSEK